MERMAKIFARENYKFILCKFFFMCLHFHAFNVELKIYENIVNSKKLWSIEEETGIVQCKLIYFT